MRIIAQCDEEAAKGGKKVKEEVAGRIPGRVRDDLHLALGSVDRMMRRTRIAHQ